MSSGILFQGYSHRCSDGLMETLLEACVQEIEQDAAFRAHPVLRQFFQRHLDVVYNGFYVVLPAEVIQSSDDALLVADVFERAFARLRTPDSQLTHAGRKALDEQLVPLVLRLRQFSSGTLPRGSQWMTPKA
jgi:hypothetical protein